MIFTGGHSSVYDNHWPSAWGSSKIKEYLSAVMDIVKPEVISASAIPAAILKSKETNDNKGIDKYHYHSYTNTNVATIKESQRSLVSLKTTAFKAHTMDYVVDNNDYSYMIYLKILVIVRVICAYACIGM